MSQQAMNGYDHPDYHGDSELPGGGALSLLVHWLGALLSIALVIGLGVWSYRLTMRDVSEIPVVRAMSGPMRVAPDDPGGRTAEHQGLAVNEVQAGGAAGTPPDRVVLAPEPIRLSDEDLALVSELAEGGLEPAPRNVTDVSAPATAPIDSQEEINRAVLAAVEGAGASPEARDLARLPGVKRSPRPRARARAQVRVAAGGETPVKVELVSAAAVDIDPSEVAPGTRLVQLGAFDDRRAAIAEWNAIMARHGDLIGARQRLIQEAESGGRRFYRLRMVGFDDLSDSQRLCSALLARGTPCIPVTAR